MPFNIQPVRPLKRGRVADDDDEDDYFVCRKQQRTLDFEMNSDSDSTGTMDIDDMGQNQSTTTETSDYQMSTLEPAEGLKKCYYGPGVMAFPQTLEIFNVENTNWYWNASSWVQTRALDAVECNQICSYYQARHGWAPSTGYLPALQLGTSEDMISRSTPQFSTFVVFPTAGGDIVRSEPFMRAWTDIVMVPALLQAARKREGFSYGVPPYARSYRAIKMASECQRVVSNDDVLDTPVSIRVRPDELGELWQSMQHIVRSSPMLWNFQDMFLVVVAGRDSENGMQCFGSNLMAFWKHFSHRWDKAVNMNYVPAELVTISPKVYFDAA